MFPIKLPFSVASHIRKAANTTGMTNKTKAAEVRIVSGVPYFHNGTTGTPFAIGAAGALKFAAGSGAFASGAVTIATGLAGVAAFWLTPTHTTGAATGATEITEWRTPGITGTTGAVAVQGYRLWSITPSVSGTATFTWGAIGT